MFNAKREIEKVLTKKNINPIDEWIKWLEYSPEFIEQRIESLQKRDYENLSIEELQEVIEYLQEKTMLTFFKEYKNNTASEDECAQIYKYMQKNILSMFNKKLTKEEKEVVLNKIIEYEEKDDDELEQIINTKVKKYNRLNMIDSYVLHIICSIKSVRNLEQKEEKEIKKYYYTNN